LDLRQPGTCHPSHPPPPPTPPAPAPHLAGGEVNGGVVHQRLLLHRRQPAPHDGLDLLRAVGHERQLGGAQARRDARKHALVYVVRVGDADDGQPGAGGRGGGGLGLGLVRPQACGTVPQRVPAHEAWRAAANPAGRAAVWGGAKPGAGRRSRHSAAAPVGRASRLAARPQRPCPAASLAGGRSPGPTWRPGAWATRTGCTGPAGRG
jgi:hypothetical protein